MARDGVGSATGEGVTTPPTTTTVWAAVGAGVPGTVSTGESVATAGGGVGESSNTEGDGVTEIGVGVTVAELGTTASTMLRLGAGVAGSTGPAVSSGMGARVTANGDGVATGCAAGVGVTIIAGAGVARAVSAWVGLGVSSAAKIGDTVNRSAGPGVGGLRGTDGAGVKAIGADVTAAEVGATASAGLRLGPGVMLPGAGVSWSTGAVVTANGDGVATSWAVGAGVERVL